MHRLAAMLCLFASPLFLNAQTPTIRLTLADGSQVRGALVADSLTLDTAYGPLTIPASDILSITFGIHGDEVAIGKAVRALASDVHREREAASKKLVDMGRQSLAALALAHKSTDAETANRSLGVQQAIFAADPGAEKAPLLDTIVARQMTATGKIKLDTFKLKSELLGDLNVRLADCRELHASYMGNSAVALDAIKYGSDLTAWFDTRVEVPARGRLSITATGAVDLWPQGPGQYIAAPKGYNTAGKGGQFMAGSLVGKIGAEGKAFYVGEKFSTVTPERGTLFLQIVPSPWNNVSSGAFNVEVRVGE